jgi:hypothetical protein
MHGRPEVLQGGASPTFSYPKDVWAWVGRRNIIFILSGTSFKFV